MSNIRILAISPGSTSTKFAVYFGEECKLKKTLRHSVEELSLYENVGDQFEFRKDLIIDSLVEEGFDLDKIKYIIGRGGITHTLKSGVYLVNSLMLNHVSSGIYGQHASNLGPMIADYIAMQIPGAKAYIADPVVIDEFEDIARFSGHPLFERRSIYHALNQKATARFHARKIGREYENLNLIVVHLGGGISVGAHHYGRVIDVNNALDGEGPFSPERSGTLPVGQLIDLCFSKKYEKDEIRRMVIGEGGFVAYLGTNDALEVEKRVQNGDNLATKIRDAMGYQVAKAIGEMAVVLNGAVDAIILTGGLAYSKYLVQYITSKVEFISCVYVYPGEDELEALALNALLVASGKIKPLEYTD